MSLRHHSENIDAQLTKHLSGVAGLTGRRTLVADFCTLFATFFAAIAARLRARDADLFAQLAGLGVQGRLGFAQLGAGHAHVVARQAHLGTFGFVILAAVAAFLA